MPQPLTFGFVVFGLFAGVLALLELGRRIATSRRMHDVARDAPGFGVVDGAVFGLMGLIVAFTFSGAAARFDARRQLIGQEANAIGTAYLRLDLLPVPSQAELRDHFREYLDARLSYYKNLAPNSDAARAERARATGLQGRIWSKAVAGCQQQGSPATTTLVLSSLNDMIDITTTRAVALQTHPPLVIYWGLLVLILASALLAGYAMAESTRRSWIHMLLYSIIMAAAVYVIFDLEYPRIGLVRIDAADQVLMDLRNTMQ